MNIVEASLREEASSASPNAASPNAASPNAASPNAASSSLGWISPAERSGLRVARVASRFRLRGVMPSDRGRIFEAQDERNDRRVVLKVAEDGEANARLEAEATWLRRLRGQGAPRILDVADDGGLVVLVLERLYGETLADRLRRGPLSSGQAEVVERLALRALRQVHRRGVGHGAIDAEHLFLCGGFGGPPKRVTFLGFGGAREGRSAVLQTSDRAALRDALALARGARPSVHSVPPRNVPDGSGAPLRLALMLVGLAAGVAIGLSLSAMLHG